MAEKVGGKLVYGLGVFLTAVLTVISPFAAYWGLVPFLVVRVAEGFTEVNTLNKRFILFFYYYYSLSYIFNIGCYFSCNAHYACTMGSTIRKK